MNVSEYMVKYLKSRGVDHFFGYQGTMIAYFVDAVGRDESVKNHVCYNEQGAALVSGCTPRLFQMVTSGELSPYAYMLDVLSAPRYRDLTA